MRYRCAICNHTAGLMPPSGKCDICGQSGTYIPHDEPRVNIPSRRASRPAPTEPSRPPVHGGAGKPAPAKQPRVQKPSVEKSKNTAKSKWSWWAAIIGFFMATGYSMNEVGMDRNAALVVGGIVGLICGFYYVQIIVLAVVVFIAYALLQKQ